MVRMRASYYCEHPSCPHPPFDNEEEAIEHEKQEHCKICGLLMKRHPVRVKDAMSGDLLWVCDGIKRRYAIELEEADLK